MKDFFTARQVEMSDNSELHEVVMPDGERIASSESEFAMHSLAMALNCALEEAALAHPDIVVNML